MSTNLDDASGASSFTIAGSCPVCDYVAENVSPRDAVITLRSLPTRWRNALAVHLDDADPEAVLTGRTAPGGWTALDHAGHVRDVLHALDIRLQRVLREDDPVLPATHVTPPAGANEQGPAVVLAALSVSTDQLSQTIEQVPSAAWGRRARRAGTTVSALDLVHEAVHEASHHLRLAAMTMAELRAASASVAR
jgi:hypothetical protein